MLSVGLYCCWEDARAQESEAASPAAVGAESVATPAASPPDLPADSSQAITDSPAIPLPEVAAEAMSYSVSLSHFAGFEAIVEPLTSLSFSAGYKFGEHSFSVSQDVDKYYFVDPKGATFVQEDTSLGYSRPLAQKPFASTLKAGVSATVPISEYSRIQGVLTKIRLSVSGAKDFMDGKLSLNLGTFFRYQLNRFQTTVTSPSGGGQPMPWIQYGVSMDVSYQIHEKWSLSASNSYSELWFEKTERGDRDPEYLPQHPYNFDFSVNYAPEPPINVGCGYSYGSRFEQAGRFDFVLFDQYASYWFLTAGYSI